MKVTTIDAAAHIDLAPGQFWSLPRGNDFTGQVIDDFGYIMGEVVVTDNAAITEVEAFSEGYYLVRGNQGGERFEVETYLDDDITLVLVDER